MDRASSRVEMTLKSTDGSKITSTSVLGRRFEDFKEGDIVICTVKRIEKFGLFLSIDKSSVVSICLLYTKYSCTKGGGGVKCKKFQFHS